MPWKNQGGGLGSERTMGLGSAIGRAEAAGP